MALALVAAQVQAQRAARTGGFEPTLGWVYFNEAYVKHAALLLGELQQRWPGTAWVGASAVGVIGSGVEYTDTPALSLMLADLPPDSLQVFNGRRPLDPSFAQTAQVHLDGTLPDVPALLHELAERTTSSYLFGGLCSGRGAAVQIAEGVFEGGLSGVAYAPRLRIVSRVTQGCTPVGPPRHITACEGNVVLQLDGAPALPLLLSDIGQTLQRPEPALRAMRATLAGLTAGDAAVLGRGRQFDIHTRVRHLIGIDPQRDAVALADRPQPGEQLTWCRRDVEAARRDLVRICAEIRDEVDAEQPLSLVPAARDGTGATAPSGGGRIAGALFISCAGRGGAHFGGPSAEALIVRRTLGDVPLTGFFAGGEVAHHHLYGYTGVLTVFVCEGD